MRLAQKVPREGVRNSDRQRTAEVNELVLSVTASMEAEAVVFAFFFARTAASRAWVATVAYAD